MRESESAIKWKIAKFINNQIGGLKYLPEKYNYLFFKKLAEERYGFKKCEESLWKECFDKIFDALGFKRKSE